MSKIGVVLVSHSMEDVAQHTDRIAVMHDGTLKMCGTPAEIFAKAGELESLRLDIPQITKILNELRARGIDVPADIFNVKQAAEWILKNAPRSKG